MPDDVITAAVYVFGPFRLDPVRRTLTRHGQPLTLTPRIFDLLLCLLQNHGRTVDRRELMHAAWGDRVVEDANLRQTIYELRKALEPGEGAPVIATVPLRGYRLTLPVQRLAPTATDTPPASPAPRIAWAPRAR